MDSKVRNVPPDIWHEFKLHCVEQNISINKKIIELVTKEVERRRKRKEK